MTAGTTFDYAMPSLGADMEEGQVVEWRVAVGDTVSRGDVVARVETEKADIDIEIWHDGVVVEMLVDTNRIVAVGTPIMRLGSAGSDGGVDDRVVDVVEPAGPPPQRPAVLPPAPRHEERVVAPAAGVLASPLARRMAHDSGIDLAAVAGSGPGGAIRARDLEAPAGRPTPAEPGPAPGTAPRIAPEIAPEPAPETAPDRSTRMRAMIAGRMARANREIPHYFLERQVDLGPLTDRLSRENESRPIGDRILAAAAFVRATALAAARHPELNGHWVDDHFRPGAGVNVAVAISLRGGGLLTPSIEHADGCSLQLTMAKLQEFTLAARSGSLRSEWTRVESTITVTNLGERGADLVHGVISPPEVALVGFGRVVERPWVVAGNVVVRPIVTVTLAADHRATDGAVGSRFLAAVAKSLEHPEEL